VAVVDRVAVEPKEVRVGVIDFLSDENGDGSVGDGYDQAIMSDLSEAVQGDGDGVWGCCPMRTLAPVLAAVMMNDKTVTAALSLSRRLALPWSQLFMSVVARMVVMTPTAT